jgi:hypothetical protein
MAEIRNHAISLPFVHKIFVLLKRPAFCQLQIAREIREASAHINGDGPRCGYRLKEIPKAAFKKRRTIYRGAAISRPGRLSNSGMSISEYSSALPRGKEGCVRLTLSLMPTREKTVLTMH